MIPTLTPMRSTKRPFGRTLQTSDDIWVAAKAGRVESRPSPYRVIRSISTKCSADSVHPVARGDCLEFADDAPVALVDELLGVAWVLRQPRPRRQRRAALVLAGQQAAAEREVGQYPQSERLGRRNELALDVPHEQAVLVLT